MLIHSNAPMSAYVVQLARKMYPLIEDDVGTILQNGALHFMCQKPGVLLVIQPPEEYMLRRSATDIQLKIGECVWAFTITDGADTMVRYAADHSRGHVMTRVSNYLTACHPTWRITKLDKVSKVRTLNAEG